MSRSHHLQRAVHLSLVAASLGLITPSYAQQQPAEKSAGTLGAVIVTAQKREENLVDVPIAVSAFDSEAMDRKQIDQATDLQFNIPNVSFTKTNFTSSNFQIRGIGVSSVGSSSDSGVETHFNSVPIKNPRLFETEYFDVERVEVLRGPQGTLYGRNATGGAVNVLPKKPVLGELGGEAEVEFGNYHERKSKAALNLPIGDTFAVRLAGIYYVRDGFTENLYTHNDVDGRDQYAVRGSLRFAPSEATDIALTVNYYKEDSTRARNLKQMCHSDPNGNYGCLPDRLAFETVNSRGTLGGNLAELLPLVAGFPALTLPGTNTNANAVNPSDLRKVYAEFDPTYEADETIATLEIKHDFGAMTLTSVSGFQKTSFVGRTDYNWNAGAPNYNGPALALLGGSVPLSEIDPSLRGSLNGILNSRIPRSASSVGYDQSDQDGDQLSQELRINSNFEGAFNFQLGAIYFTSDVNENYYVVVTELDYAAAFLGSQPPYYINGTPSAKITSTALFGETYWEMTDSFKWTAGARVTRDKKSIKDRQLLLSVPAASALPDYRTDENTFTEVTGRFGFDWKPGYGDDSTLYAFYSRGYKAGGFNPPLDRTNPAFAGTAEIYEPEFINALELGSKNVLAGGRVNANFSAFFYDYSDLQVSKIVARTSVNENIDANIYGVEAEFLFAPVDNFLIDLSLSWLKTSIKDAQSIDPRDPRNGDTNFTVVKDATNGSNYIIPTAAIPTAVGAGCLLNPALGGPFGLLSVAPACAAFFTDGVDADLDGNQLPYSPEFSVKIGMQYTFNIGEMKLTPRADYYWRDDFYARIFNKPIDQIESWDLLNAQVELSSNDDKWFMRATVNNVLDDDNITGMYVTDASSGLFTNVFALDPRTYGVTLGIRF